MMIAVRPAVSLARHFPSLKCIFNSDSASAIQNPPTGSSRAAMHFYYYGMHVTLERRAN